MKLTTSRYKSVRLHRHKNRDLLFLPRTLVGKDEHVHPTLLALWKYHARIQEFSPRGEGGGPKKTLITFFRHQLFLQIYRYQWFIQVKENYIFKVPEGVQHFTWEGVQIFPGGGANVNIELVNFQGGGGSGPLDPRMRMIDPLASSERQIFSCNGSIFIARATSDTSKHD